MIKVLVVDDEELILDKIVYLLKKSAIEFESILCAGNGHDALNLIAAGHIPDIILSDVRMPVMNGLELIERVRSLHSQVRFIVISGYAEFEYAVKAMQYGVTNYVLKPVKEHELIVVVEQMRDEIVKVQLEKEAMQQTESVKDENKRMFIEKMLYQMLNDHQGDHSLRIGLDKNSGILSHQVYIVSAIKLHPDQQQAQRYIYTKMQQHFGEKSDHIWMLENTFGKDTFILIFGGKDGEDIVVTAVRETKLLHKLLREEYQVAATMGISNACSDLRAAYQNGITALKSRFLYGVGSIYVYSSNVFHKDRALQSFIFKVKLVEKSLESKSMLKSIGILRQFAEELFIDRIADYLGETSIDYLFNEYLNIIIRFCLKNNIEFLDKIEPNVISGKTLEGLDDNRAIVKLIGTTLDNIFNNPLHADGEYLQHNRALHSSVVDNIILYINRNINEEITLQMISEKFAINPSYLSRVFKAATEQGFVKYVTGLKIVKALELLENSSMEIADIAHGLGFSDQQYFNRVFKKTTEMTPSEARSRSKKSPKKT
ncbi:putative two-component sensor response regulator [Paenibacillus baekrokdamisoli]|uniref:Putative two-component sensor response regulator n=1 Tax=Paenibacillus baekrokdamisoli TaxID=1712516 RepID=A0A3G9IRQ5_9BACL|nr:response regulator [Paenibacillus baekrokdamisoli]MBB3071129.1 YesN/AraC family two-component response regulator [Paenibacillus baekrokdamisoli]BBH21547.1 putative two-component sensor response regulator [Paenibacillus baekrokdamisoli]